MSNLWAASRGAPGWLLWDILYGGETASRGLP